MAHVSLSKGGSGAFTPLTMILVLVIGVAALAGLGILSAYAPELKSGDDGGTHALSRSSVGYAALPRLLRATGTPVVLNRGSLGNGSSDSFLILTPSVGTPPVLIEDMRHEGSVMVVLPKWNYTPLPDHRGWVSTVGVVSADQALSVLPQEMRYGTTLSDLPGRQPVSLRRAADALLTDQAVVIDTHRRIVGSQWMPVIVDADGGTVLATHRETGLYVLADADVLNTQGLKSLAGARTALALLDALRPHGTPVVFDLTLHGFQRTRNLGRLLLEPPFVGMTVVLVALILFAGWQATVRYGPARQNGRVVALGKRALADNTAALVRMAGREHHMGPPYALLVRAAVARAIGAPRDLAGDDLDAFLDRVGVIAGATRPYTALAESARAARTPGDLIRVARDLHRWTQEMTRARQ
ncbi:DUF4350 domain-containing protein [Brevundimonas subvibrioides]|uniref:DUF4350 domain-containing protein n=1 Tax=Brevundimonas subvibrioides (strain ATCC 15264 / DSM 4735 / LMG 14903 / NBRC 16000 / CB 81) TaxID=633149 RepID=D9QH96_BRESC|nr:DUF4350 domain-containing protein [Brevundimonas subvibrioides]ADL01062.1 conserved hypothetical protein [Brevundimonas subvibrioides ATCC 15264]